MSDARQMGDAAGAVAAFAGAAIGLILLIGLVVMGCGLIWGGSKDVAMKPIVVEHHVYEHGKDKKTSAKSDKALTPPPSAASVEADFYAARRATYTKK